MLESQLFPARVVPTRTRVFRGQTVRPLIGQEQCRDRGAPGLANRATFLAYLSPLILNLTLTITGLPPYNPDDEGYQQYRVSGCDSQDKHLGNEGMHSGLSYCAFADTLRAMEIGHVLDCELLVA